MSRRSFLMAIGIVLVLVLSIGATLYALLHYEPESYRRAAIEPGETRDKQSAAFLHEFFSFLNSMNTDPDSWYGTFREEQINSYLADQFMRCGLGAKILPEGISEPRITFEPDRLSLAFRYRSRLVNTVVSISARIWLPKVESNVVAVQLDGFWAGALPFTAQWLLERISESARQNGIEVNWYRHEGHPVALLRFQADQARPTLQLTGIKLEAGSITIHGRTSDQRTATVHPEELFRWSSDRPAVKVTFDQKGQLPELPLAFLERH